MTSRRFLELESVRVDECCAIICARQAEGTWKYSDYSDEDHDDMRKEKNIRGRKMKEEKAPVRADPAL